MLDAMIDKRATHEAAWIGPEPVDQEDAQARSLKEMNRLVRWAVERNDNRI